MNKVNGKLKDAPVMEANAKDYVEGTKISTGDIVNATDTTNYYLGAFCMSFFGKEHNKDVVLARAKNVMGCLVNLGEKLEQLIKEYEAI